jgi:hypothetical protein
MTVTINYGVAGVPDTTGGGGPTPPDGDGSLATYGPEVITAVGGITPAADIRQLRYVKAGVAAGETIVTANPQIVVGTQNGQELILRGSDDADYIVLNDGNGLSLNGAIKLTTNATLTLLFDGTKWIEQSRR